MGMVPLRKAGIRPAVLFVVLTALAFGAGYLSRGPARGLPYPETPPSEDHPPRETAPPPTREVEQQTLAINRLTSPYLECPGAMDADLRLVAIRRVLARFIRETRSSDPSLSVSLYARDLNNGPWIGIDQDEPYPPASLSKVPVMLYVLSEAEADPHLLGKMVTYPGPAPMPSEDNMGWAPAEMRMVPGRAYSYEDLLYRMVALSDNHARDLLMAEIDESDLEGMMASIHAEEIHADNRALMTPKTYSAYFRILYNSTLLGRAMSEYGLAILSQSFLQDGLRKYLPPDITVASKFGYTVEAAPSTEVHFHECGIVYHPAGPYILCVMTGSSQASSDDLVEVVARISQLVWEEKSR